MKCPRCGNDVQPDEAFCGQCGLPRMSIEASNPPALSTGGLPGPDGAGASFTPTRLSPNPGPGALNMRPQGAQLPSRPLVNKSPSSQNGAYPANPAPNASSGQQAAPSPHNGFYRDATEAMTIQPSVGPTASQPGGYAPMSVPATTVQTNYSGAGTNQYRPPVQNTPYGQQSFSGFESGGQGYPPIKPALPPQKQQNGMAVLVIGLCVAVGLICVIGFVVYLTNSHTTAPPTSTANVVSAPTAIPTVAPPTPTPTLAPTPTPTIVPTPLPDSGFIWCGPECASYGFVEEYPQGWLPAATPASNGIQFASPTQPDAITSFMAIGPTVNPASAILANEIQTNYATKAGYVPATATSTNTIGGETWVTAVIYYQSITNPQLRERVEIFTTVFNGKGYIIKLQAPDQLFDNLNATYFAYMLNKYHIVQ